MDSEQSALLGQTNEVSKTETSLEDVLELTPEEDNNKTMNKLAKLDLFLGVLVKFVIIGGLATAYIQWKETQQNSRINKTFDYIHSYEHGEILQSRENIRRLIKSYEDQYYDIVFSEEKSRQLALAFVNGDAGVSISDDIDRLVDYFRGLDICIQQSLCEKSVALIYFGEILIDYWKWFEPYIDERRKNNNPSFGSAFEALYNEKAALLTSLETDSKHLKPPQ